MIVDKYTELMGNAKIFKYYKNKGYDIKCGEYFKVKVNDLTKGSHKEILCKCDICGIEKYVKYLNYNNYLKRDPNNQYTCKICNLKKREKTNLKKYNVKNISQTKKAKDKKKKTMKSNGTIFFLSNKKEYKKKMLKLYGVGNPSQHKDIHLKQHSGYILKHYNGLYYRGSYEKDFIDHCIEKNIKIENFIGTIDYIFENKNKKYFPDFFIKDLNLVIEIKSSWTFEVELEKNLQKEKSTKNSGFNFLFIINKDYEIFNEMVININHH